MIHIILCTFNGQEFIKQQMDSILMQSNQDWTLHVFDDGSTDDTLEIIKGYSSKLSARLKIHKGQQAGSAKTNFMGGILSVKRYMIEGDYVMLCDQDDVWLPRKIETTLNRMKKLEWETETDCLDVTKTPLLVFTDSTLVDEKNDAIHPSFMGSMGFDMSQLSFANFLMENKVQGSTTMFNKALADLVTFIPEHMDMHDWWLALIASARGRISFVSESTMYYRQHSKAVTSEKMSFWRDIKWKFMNLSKQRNIVFDKIPQALELMDSIELGEEKMRVARAFVSLPDVGFFERRRLIKEHGLWKSGKLKNLGLMILI
ncbi:MAG: glycosyltransferase family 2 protein [Pseudobutyrivibrio sp.]|nr:glycosyltransferase family 2 protein [Pseudobutyrivibrio sp.]